MSFQLDKKQRVKEILKCGKDPSYFLNAYARISHPMHGLILFDTYDFQDGSQHGYIVYVQDATGKNIAAKEAYGIPDRTKVTKEFVSKYGNRIDKIEHEK